jgi:hypothetical protein
MEHPDVFGRTDYPKLAKRQAELARIIDLFNEKHALEEQLTTQGRLRMDQTRN